MYIRTILKILRLKGIHSLLHLCTFDIPYPWHFFTKFLDKWLMHCSHWSCLDPSCLILAHLPSFSNDFRIGLREKNSEYYYSDRCDEIAKIKYSSIEFTNWYYLVINNVKSNRTNLFLVLNIKHKMDVLWHYHPFFQNTFLWQLELSTRVDIRLIFIR